MAANDGDGLRGAQERIVSPKKVLHIHQRVRPHRQSRCVPRCGPSVQPKLHGLRGRETQINVRSLPSVSESQRRRNATQSVIAQQNAAATQQGAASAASTAAWASVMQASRPLSVTYLHNGI